MEPTRKIVDVAEEILRIDGSMELLKLHFLLFYVQGWSLAVTGKPLFKDKLYMEEYPHVKSLDSLLKTSIVKRGDVITAYKKRKRNKKIAELIA